MKRRSFLLGSAGVIIVAGFALKPGDAGGPYDSYFGKLNDLMKRNKVGRPAMLIDIGRLNDNATRLMAHLTKINRHYRIVSKSLPSVDLIRHVMTHTGSHRVMVFQQPFLNDLVKAEPQSDILLGKPMPVDAAERFYQVKEGAFNPEKQLQWLIDTHDRLKTYLALAKRLNTKMRVNIEIDVGLHRGGLTRPEQLDPMMQTIQANPDHLEYAGFMGYDGQVGRIPAFMESAQTTLDKSDKLYQQYVDYLFQQYPAMKQRKDLTFNGGGSLSVMLHDTNTPPTELSSGSCLVMPSDFESEQLKDFQAAAFIGTPVLKEWEGLTMPGPGPLGKLWQLWDVNRKKTFFIYGGYWKAKPVSPPGLEANPLYGYSSNQMMYNGSSSIPIGVGDYIFLQPTQSEAVLLHFGDLLAEKNDKLVQWWPGYSQQYDHI